MKKVPALLLILMSVGLVKTQAQIRPLVFRGVTIIDMTGAPPKPDMTIVISGGRIADVGKTKDVTIPKNARVVDASGKFLIPGLWDMHWHLRWKSETRNVLFPLMIANGVTGVRDMFSDCIKNCAASLPTIKTITQWRREFAAGTLVAPRILASSQILDGAKPIWEFFYPVANAGEARQAVRTLKGAESILLRFTRCFRARLRILHQFGFARRERVDEIQMLDAFLPGIGGFDCRYVNRDVTDKRNLLFFCFVSDPATGIERIKNNPYFGGLVYNVLDTNIARAADSYDRQKLLEASEVFLKNGTWVCPTLAYHHADAFHDQKEYAEDPRLKYVSKDFLDEWAELKNARVSMPHRMAEMKRVFPISLKIIGAMRRAGVNFLAGTDATNIHVVPGFSLHDELAFLVQAGFTPMEAMQAATINPARFLEREQDLGTIEAGKFADLVLLETNPLDDIRNTKKIAAVVINGRYFSKGALQKILASASGSAKKG